jgi:diketogulonate reductase-like aldo/keto reductase
MPLDLDQNHAVRRAGAVIPKLGLGTWELRGEQCATIVAAALKQGYRHIDTAQGYANEAEVGEGLAASGVARDSVFITTKVLPQMMGDGDLQASTEASLKKLGVSHIDLLLLHWPNPNIALAETITALNAVKRQGLVRHIGLSNFPSRLLEQAWSLTHEPFACEQLDITPTWTRRSCWRPCIAATWPLPPIARSPWAAWSATLSSSPLPGRMIAAPRK